MPGSKLTPATTTRSHSAHNGILLWLQLRLRCEGARVDSEQLTYRTCISCCARERIPDHADVRGQTQLPFPCIHFLKCPPSLQPPLPP